MPLRPVGTTEARGANIAGFARPYGTHTITIASIPSSKLLGYCQASLRDGPFAKYVQGGSSSASPTNFAGAYHV